MNTIYCWWTGSSPMSSQRRECLENLRVVSECNVILVTPDTLSTYILQEHPLHEAYQYLSETQKGDYLKAYFMNFHGGGYSDIKKQSGSWVSSFNAIHSTNAWMCGYKEINGGVAYKPHAHLWRELVGNGAYICKPNTPLTNEWYSEMLKVLDKHLPALRLHPAQNPQDCKEKGLGYPIEWNELNGRIFHRISYKYKEHILRDLPILSFSNYR